MCVCEREREREREREMSKQADRPHARLTEEGRICRLYRVLVGVGLFKDTSGDELMQL